MSPHDPTFDHPYTIEDVRSILKIGEMTPERFVALTRHRWMLGGPLGFRYDDPEVDAHVRRVNRLLRSSDEELDALRRQWLSAEEYERVRAEIAEMSEPGYADNW